MKQSDLPTRSPKVFAQGASGSYVRTVPQTTADPVAASYDTGFPPDTFTDESAGGTPPDGRDFNGLFRDLSAWTRWVAAGSAVPYDPTFQAAVGGYPKGACVLSLVNPLRVWLCLADDNTSDPDAGGGGWYAQSQPSYQDYLSPGSTAATVPPWVSYADIEIIGGGGGGAGGTLTKSGGGGGAGGYSRGVVPVTAGASIAIVIGAGGAGGASGGDGAAGGGSSFGGYSVGGGDSGKIVPSSAGGSGGGAANSGLRNFPGGQGGDGSQFANDTPGGNGSPGPHGGQGRTGAAAGQAASGPGAGGGGCWEAAGGGGNGGNGAVLIRWLP